MMMKLTFLGTGTSTGVPTIACNCEVCRSTDVHDKRLRCSSLLQVEDKNILLDCGPDFRQQALAVNLTKVDALLLTHPHFDHIGGLDDLRVFPSLPVYGLEATLSSVQKVFAYCFQPSKYQGMLPKLQIHSIGPDLSPFFIDNIKVTPIFAMHAFMPVLGYRIGNFAYLTDLKTITDVELQKLLGLEVLVLGMLRFEPHPSHLSLSEATAIINKVKPGRTYFVHMSHDVGLHAVTSKLLPPSCFLAYDGLQITF